MDCLMPEVDGFQATKALRDRERREGGSQIPIIALTANAFASDREKCLAAGMSDYLSNPFTADDIERQLRKWLSHGVGAGSAAA
jgi:two-component system, sensor histidine kinase